jgi:hypothetical protein
VLECGHLVVSIQSCFNHNTIRLIGECKHNDEEQDHLPHGVAFGFDRRSDYDGASTNADIQQAYHSAASSTGINGRAKCAATGSTSNVIQSANTRGASDNPDTGR